MALFRTLARTLFPEVAFRAYHWFLAALAAPAYGFPSRRLVVIGVTGTDGKTSVVELLHEVLASAGYRVGSVSSLRFKINDRTEPNLLKMTMPGPIRLQRFLAECRGAGCRFAIIEVTSQGILQSRHRFIRFSAAVLTNVTPEHIEAHGGFERYRSSKLELFRALPKNGRAILNREDPSGDQFAAATPAAVVWYSRSAIERGRVGHPVRVISVEPSSVRLEIDDRFIEARIGGAFNVMNVLAAAATALALDVSLPAIATGIGRVAGIPGRMEFIQREPFAVVVDYANTPAAYEQAYRTLQSAKRESQSTGLICVFGAPGGGRDRWKRPELGKIAAQFCKSIILTSDDPDDEDPIEIVREIQKGIVGNKSAIAEIVPDRRQAIRSAIARARPGDTVIITGMGAQPWLVISGKKIPWDDRRIAREALGGLLP